MENEQSYLRRLLGKTFTKTEMATSTTFPIENSRDYPNDGRMEITLLIFFEDYNLEIFNPITIIPNDKELLDFIGLKVIDTGETKDEAELIFDNGYKIIVNMRNDVYYGPEAMCLNGPDNFWVVWN